MNQNAKLTTPEEYADAMQELLACRKKVSELRRNLPSTAVDDYEFVDGDGTKVTLSSLFGDHDDLIVVHNMGKGCPYCTLWADGFNGVRQHLENRAAFALVSPDPPEVVKEFAAGRGWTFRVLSNAGGAFTRDMGYEGDKGDPHPGLSTFRRAADGTISRVSHAPFGPGDDFCAVWPMFDMLAAGVDNWQPKFEY